MGQRGEMWVAVQAVLLVVFIALPVGEAPWPYETAFRAAGWMIAALGMLLLARSALNLGRSLTPLPRPKPGGELVTSGAYRFVRHPIYLGVLLACLGVSLATTSLLRLGLTAILFIFFDMKARKEERWLAERYPEYVQYQARVKKLIPWVY
ncbi:MAG TPA: isoprenylcysteine carboxylmethyltransferase family protein [Noviherbaspirillum sp.]|jgi:protein-S-isoprenylcysteine O-methyltransferase Ste14|uniref:methyltransferase family protein n=1 Tax=Noviherbaspirillum sp. TaxID=1926288 RepID=UPI002DDD6C5A|nr:isoprenylcysteine carboxylmethyltransferase family protein [Noviherbaspirillum sp.]HEV2612155.1 isoprenylcysteine carboxylmethyltransferase family protein [Noviherbaspirillum sp.]